MRSEPEGTAAGTARLHARRRLRRGLLAAVVLLYLASVPWYRSTDAPLVIWLGLPDWVAVAVLCYAGAAVLNALAWLLHDVEDHGVLPRGLRERSDTGTGPESAA